MDTLKEYTIQFIGLKLGKHSFTFHIESAFFDSFKYDDFQSIDCMVDLILIKKTTLIEFYFVIKGSAVLNCDITNKIYTEKLNNSLNLIIQFGEVYNDDNEDVLILPHGEHQLNLAQYIYEAIILALPTKRIHPGIKNGTLKSKVLEKLKELEIREHKETDPRWDKLNELLTTKKS